MPRHPPPLHLALNTTSIYVVNETTPNAADLVYARVKQRILQGDLEGGRMLSEGELAADYLDRLLPLVTLAHDGFAVSFGRGLTARYTDGALADFGVTVQAMVSMGLAFVGHHDGTGRTSFPSSARSHAVLHRHLPTVLDSRQVSYLRLLHGQQDRDVGRAASDPTQSRVVPDLDETLADLFPTVVGASDTASGTTGEPQAPFAR